MKKYTLSLGLIFAFTLAMAYSGPNLAMNAKAVNLKEIKEQIKYPQQSNLNGVEGTVLMYVEIDEKGIVTNKTVLSFPCTQLKEAAEKAVDNLEFTPAKNELGESIKSGVRIPFEFKLTVD